MTVLFSDYINGGPLGTWDSTTGTFSIVQSSLFTDGYGVQLSVSANNSWSSLNKGVQSNSAIFNCRISIVLPAVPTAGDELEVINSSYNGECRMILTPQGVRMQNWIDDSVTSVSWVANRRYFLELEFKRDATAGFVHLYLDGTLIYSKTGATGLATYANFAIGLRQSGSWENVPRSVIIGDVVMADAYIGITEVPMFIDISPLTATITAGDTQQFQSTVSNAPSTPTVTWIDADTSAVLGTGATYSFTGQTAGTYRLFARATAGSQTADSAVATITVVSGGTGTEYTVMAGAVWKTALATGTENHYWGQLGNGAIGLQGKQIWLNIDGVTQTSVRPFTGFTYPVTTLADGGIDLCWYMDIPGVYAVCAEFLGDDVYAPCKGPVFYVNVGNVQPPDTYEPPGPNTPAYITTGFWKTSVNKGSENHIWGQLSDGIQGVGGRKIWLNVNGLTKTDAKPFNPPQYAYPCITNPDGGFDLCWIMEETGTFNIAAEFLGETWASGNSLLPIKGTITPIQVLGLYNPPITPVTQNAPNPDRRIRNDRVAISCNPMFIYDNPQKLADYIASGSAWTRIELNWMNLEANGDGVFHFTNDMYGDNTDLAVQAMFDNHIALVGLLDYGNPAYTGAWNNPPTTQTQIDAWLRFVRAVVERYKDKIAYWEIWNEPNAPNFWGGETTGPGMGGNAVNYSNLLKQTSTLIRSIDPTAKIMTAGIWGSDCLFIKTIYEQGCKDYFDIMTLHPYGGIANFLWGWYNLVGWDPATWGAYSPFDYCVQAKVWEIMRHYGDGNKPMWITEYCDYAVADTSNEVWGDYVGIDPVQLWDVG